MSNERGCSPLTPEDLVSEGLTSVAEAAKFLHVSRSTIYALMEKGQLPYCKISKTRRVPIIALRTLAATQLRAVNG